MKRLAGDQVIVDVNSPSYQNVRLDFKVKFLRGREPEIHLQLLKRELTAFLSPWAFDAHRPISFGGVVYRSVLLDFVEERDYVDYATDFKMYSYTGTASFGPDLVEVQARTPDAILVSDAAHDVAVIGR